MALLQQLQSERWKGNIAGIPSNLQTHRQAFPYVLSISVVGTKSGYNNHNYSGITTCSFSDQQFPQTYYLFGILGINHVTV